MRMSDQREEATDEVGCDVTQAVLDEFLGEADRLRLVRLCAMLSGFPDAAEDLAQETLLEAWRNQHKLEDPDGVDRWLAAIARNVCRRWARRHGRDLGSLSAMRTDFDVVDDVDLVADLERAEMVEVLKRALGLLPTATREALIQSYIYGSPHAEIAGRLGLSVEAVAMRVHRGKSALRQLLQTELRDEAPGSGMSTRDADGWTRTSARCAVCGTRTLRMRTDSGSGLLSFWCPGCHSDPAQLSYQYRLGNPFFARLFHELTQPTAILARAADWSCRYFQGGVQSGHVQCTRCGRRVAVQQFVRDGASGDLPCQRGIVVACSFCGEQVCSSAQGMALALPRVRQFLREHPSARLSDARGRADNVGGTTVVGFVDGIGGASVDVVFARDSLRLLSVELGVATSA
jgi:RNA polymerase sigma factor (sigma-70 family)